MNISPVFASSGIASLNSQVLNMLVAPAADFNSIFAAATSYPFPDSGTTPTDLLLSLAQDSGTKQGLVPAGRNMSLFDPEAAYKMMTLINNKDIFYKAQFSELNQMKICVERMQDAGLDLGSVTATTGNDSIRSRLQGFVDQYNNWIQRFNPDMQADGLLAGTRAAQISRYELEQSVGNIFNGAADGVHGLGDLGFTVDRDTGLISLDTVKLDAVLAANRRGVVGAIQEFSANFSKSASLLNADDNFIPRQLDNLNRVIHYIAENNDSLRAEFGTGDAAKPAGQIAQALAVYNQTFGL